MLLNFVTVSCFMPAGVSGMLYNSPEYRESKGFLYDSCRLVDASLKQVLLVFLGLCT